MYEGNCYGIVCQDRVGFFANVIDGDEYQHYLPMLTKINIVKVYAGEFNEVVSAVEEHVEKLRNGNSRSSQLEFEVSSPINITLEFS
jgi:hypothetical protein